VFEEDLTEAQRRAVDHGDGPLVVIAGAGSGKTRTVVARAQHLLDRGIAPERLCLLTFSRRAAAEMCSRLGPAGARVWAGTFHAVGTRFLRGHGRSVGIEPAFTVIDAADAVELMGLVRTEGGYSADARRGGRRFPSADTLVAIGSRSVNAQERLSDAVTVRFPWCTDHLDAIRNCLIGYTERKRARHLLDLDDLLLFWRALLRAGTVAPAFDAVLVDEYQDTCVLQSDIVEGLCPDGRGLTVVGDDAQAIYGFRAATPRNILDFGDRYPDATLVRLEANHRSTPEIVAVANAVMAGAAAGHSSGNVLVSTREPGRWPVLWTCRDESDEAAHIAERILAQREEGIDLRRQAVLFRAAWHADLLELELSRRDIPFVKYGGLRFLEAAHVKDLLALLRVVENPWDELAWGRALRLLDGVGPATAARIVDQLGVRAAGDPGAANPLAQFVAAAPATPTGVAGAVGQLRAALGACVALPPPPGPQVARLREFLDPVIRRRYDHADARLGDLEQVEVAAAGYPSRAVLLTDLVLDPPSSTAELAGPPGLDDDWLTLSTIHSAKGGEWDVVYVLHASDGCLPSDMACGTVEEIEEERRLLYVGCTRARTVLEISWPVRYHHNRRHLTDAHSWAQRSRFLTAPVREVMRPESTAASGPEDGAPRGRGSPAPMAGAAVASVDALLDELWK
jgi:DNA helicase-2/ATP-dependent DNA helicase PcrA